MMLGETYIKAGKEKTTKEERKEKKQVICYTYKEAIDAVINLANARAGVFPLEDDYEEAEDSGAIDIDGLAEALNVGESIKRNHVRPYAAVNIAVLRELRKREGRKVFIAIDDSFNSKPIIRAE